MTSSILRGMDIATALALGTNAAAAGRPVWWALTVGGPSTPGLMDYFDRALVNTMLHLGVDNASVGRQHVLRTNG